jgi:hypothetical protein
VLERYYKQLCLDARMPPSPREARLAFRACRIRYSY